jgi:hypothetical protein
VKVLGGAWEKNFFEDLKKFKKNLRKIVDNENQCDILFVRIK